ncbi:MAG: hypothetical protein KC731_07560, partial [Myxococcales bacterium]|nr:hypothetical protein [Myxococcales bacterium]
ERRRRRVVEAQAEARARQKREERLETQREAARRAGILEGEKIRAAVAARHEVEMQRLRLEHEAELARHTTVPRRRQGPRLLAALALLGLGAFTASAARATPGVAASFLVPATEARIQLAELRAVQATTELELEALEEELAALSALPEREETPAVTAPPARPRAKARAPKPAPSPAAPSCIDGIGDPCCAFGEIVC